MSSKLKNIFKYQQRLSRVVFLNINSLAMRLCHNCARLSKSCRVDENVDKCTKCVKIDRSCDLTSLNIARWRRLEKQRQKLKSDLRDAIAKQQRLLKQIDFVEKEQRVMMNDEFQNLKKIRIEKLVASLSNFLIDVISKQIVFSNALNDWIFIFFSFFLDEIDEISFSNFQSAWVIFWKVVECKVFFFLDRMSLILFS